MHDGQSFRPFGLLAINLLKPCFNILSWVQGVNAVGRNLMESMATRRTDELGKTSNVPQTAKIATDRDVQLMN